MRHGTQRAVEDDDEDDERYQVKYKRVCVCVCFVVNLSQPQTHHLSFGAQDILILTLSHRLPVHLPFFAIKYRDKCISLLSYAHLRPGRGRSVAARIQVLIMDFCLDCHDD